MKIKLNAYAKLNPMLSLRGIREDGYHLIDGLCLATELADAITVAVRDDDLLTVTTDVGDIVGNTAEKIASALKEKYSLPGLDVYIEKNIPFSLGAGGSSADAAGVYRALKALFPIIDLSDEELALFGADVPVMVKGGGRVRGIGETIDDAGDFPAYDVAVLYGDDIVSTRDVYRESDKYSYPDRDIDECIERFRRGEESDYLFNDLELGASALRPDRAKNILREAGFSLVAMTGSGRGVAGYTLKDFEKKLSILQEKRGDYSLLVTKLRGKHD